MNKTNTATTTDIAAISKELNELSQAWNAALEARQKTKAAFDAVYADYLAKKATYAQVGAAYDADYAAVHTLMAAHAAATAALKAYNAAR